VVIGIAPESLPRRLRNIRDKTWAADLPKSTGCGDTEKRGLMLRSGQCREQMLDAAAADRTTNRYMNSVERDVR